MLIATVALYFVFYKKMNDENRANEVKVQAKISENNTLRPYEQKLPELNRTVDALKLQLENLQKTYEYINQVWLPGSGYRRADRPDLEVYTPDFDDFQPDSILYLWVPVDPVL